MRVHELYEQAYDDSTYIIRRRAWPKSQPNIQLPSMWDERRDHFAPIWSEEEDREDDWYIVRVDKSPERETRELIERVRSERMEPWLARIWRNWWNA